MFGHKRRRTLLLIVIIALLLLTSIILVVITQNGLKTMDYQINWSDVTEVFIQNGSTGEQIIYTTPSDIKEITDYFAAFQYRRTEKMLPDRGGWSYRVAIMIGRQQYSYEFGSNWVEIDHVRYYSDEAYFQRYIDLFEE